MPVPHEGSVRPVAIVDGTGETQSAGVRIASDDTHFDAFIPGVVTNSRISALNNSSSWTRLRSKVLSALGNESREALIAAAALHANDGAQAVSSRNAPVEGRDYSSDANLIQTLRGLHVNARLAALNNAGTGVNRLLALLASSDAAENVERWLSTRAAVSGHDPSAGAGSRIRPIAAHVIAGVADAGFLNAEPGLVINARQRAAVLAETATGASGAAVTLTIPAPGAGLFQHILMLQIVKYAAAAIAGAAAPVVVTTTNLPGNPAFTFATAQAVGTQEEQLFQPGVSGLRASVAATATTIVCPATTDVIWRVNAWYLNA